MLFNSIDFMVFLPIVFMIYWFIFKRNLKSQNLFLLIASYVFYGWWDWRFLFLIAFSSAVDFIVGIRLSKSSNSIHRRLLLTTSILVNLGFLMVFKYYNFFAESLSSAFTLFGKTLSLNSLNVILPVGISFYTFQTLSYSIDVYKRKLEATNDAIAFFAFVSFFPQLVAGPIERATNLLPQFYKDRKFDYHKAVLGLKQILWGLFKKIVIADNCARYANEIFNNYTEMPGSSLLLGAVLFSFQIYGDFSGYSDIAIGTSSLFGFKLKRNFAYPYFSRDISEFWRRWHISLSTWFRDYLYIPLGGSRVGKAKMIRNVLIVFLVSGFWHGANWTFIVWGLVNALLIIPQFLRQTNRHNLVTVAENKILPSLKETFHIIATFMITSLVWVFFRSESLGQSFAILKRIFSESLLTSSKYLTNLNVQILALLIGTLVFVEWLGRTQDFALQKIPFFKNRLLRYSFYYSIIFAILWFGGQEQNFIYFQF